MTRIRKLNDEFYREALIARRKEEEEEEEKRQFRGGEVSKYTE